jgi:pantetheine-phosphate adenylyltransferase
MKIAVFPGSFDPITKGHEDLVRRALPLFDKVIVAMGINSAKKYYFDEQQRLDFLRATFADSPKVEVDTFTQLTAYYCQEKGAQFIIRGLRNSTDFDYETTIANLNATIGEVESFFLMANPQYACYSSTVVREILKGGGDASLFLPAAVVSLLNY